jgi:hypothetical protein
MLCVGAIYLVECLFKNVRDKSNWRNSQERGRVM